ncbi:hypothetical protein [Vibrio brasiliensis]
MATLAYTTNIEGLGDDAFSLQRKPAKRKLCVQYCESVPPKQYQWTITPEHLSTMQSILEASRGAL